MTEHLFELEPPRSSNTLLDAIVEVLAILDDIGFDHPEDRAMQAQALLRQRGFQVLPAIPMPAERAIR